MSPPSLTAQGFSILSSISYIARSLFLFLLRPLRALLPRLAVAHSRDDEPR